MKILDILENLTSTTFADKKYSGRFKGYTIRDDKTLGQGTFSTARVNKKEPHSVIKHSKIPLKDREGFNYYATFIANTSGAMDNIHIPKVHNISKYTDKSGKHIDVYDMERLLPHTTISADEFEHIINSSFDMKDDMVSRMVHVFGYSGATVANLIDRCVGNQDIADKIITNNEVADAIKIVKGAMDYTSKELGRGRYSGADIHEDNIMYRRTPHGIQFVISDPIVAW